MTAERSDATDSRAGDERDAASRRQRRRDELLREALRRPGMREMMTVYENWKHADRAMASHRAIVRGPGITVNRANACETR